MTFEGKIRLNLDRRGYTVKPSAFVGVIRNRLCAADSIRDLTLDQFMNAIQRGYTFTPAAMTGTTGDTWQGQQIICADIDNDSGEKDSDGNKIMLEPPMLPDEARAVMSRYGIRPCFMYYTFSNTDAWPKYRAVLILDQQLTDAAEAADLTARFAGIFNTERPGCADTTIRDSARLLYGGRAGCVFFTSREETPLDVLRALPALEAARKPQEASGAPQGATEDSSVSQAPEGQQRAQGGHGGGLRDEIEVFDLAAYISSTENVQEVRRGSKLFFNPCPMCGHNDCFQVTRHLWHCFSSNHTGTNAGTIIDYLRQRYGLNLARALSMFENKILHPASVDFAFDEAAGGPNTGDPDELAPQAPEAAEAAELGAQATTEAKNHRQKKGVGISSYILDVMPGEIDDFASMGAISTGFAYLDGKSGGGLFPGLYVVGAISGLGKTTLIHQMADQMAAGGHDVLFFSLEQSCLELATKSLARMTAKADPHNAITSLKIRRGVTSRPLSNAIRDYTQAVGDRLNIIHGGFKYTIEALRACVEQYIDEHDTRPVVILDYLQILNAEGKWPTRRDETDYLVSTLKIMSGELSVPVIAISSVNRSNYTMTIDFESLKESGGIEYTADVVWGLQYSCMTEKLFEEEKGVTKKRDRLREAKDENPRRIQLIPLKNRYGGTRWKVDFKYYPEYDWFEEFSGTALAERERIEAQEAQVRAKQAEERRKELAQKAGEKRVLRSLAVMTQKEIMKMPDPPTETDFDPLS